MNPASEDPGPVAVTRLRCASRRLHGSASVRGRTTGVSVSRARLGTGDAGCAPDLPVRSGRPQGAGGCSDPSGGRTLPTRRGAARCLVFRGRARSTEEAAMVRGVFGALALLPVWMHTVGGAGSPAGVRGPRAAPRCRRPGDRRIEPPLHHFLRGRIQRRRGSDLRE